MSHAEKPSKDRAARGPWLGISATLLPAAFLMRVDKQAMVLLAPTIQQEFDLDLQSMTAILAAATWSYAAFQVPGAWLASRLGPLIVIGLCSAVWSMVILTTPLATGPIGLASLRGLLGAAQAPDWLSSLMILERVLPLGARSRGSAALLAAEYLGALLSGPALAAIAAREGWRGCFHAIGAAGLIFGLGLTAYAFATRRSFAGSDPCRPVGADVATGIARLRACALAATYLFFSGVQSFVYVMLPLYLSGARRVTLPETGWLDSAPFAALYAAVLVGGPLSDALLRRTGSVCLVRVVVGGAAMTGSGVCFALGISAEGTASLTVLVCAGMALVGFGQVALWSAVQDMLPIGGAHLAASVQMLGAAGAGLVPLLAARLVATTGDWGGVRLLLIALGVAAAVSLGLAKPHRSTDTVDPAPARSAGDAPSSAGGNLHPPAPN